MFIERVAPQVALISSGFQNRFRHPNDRVVRRYHEHGTVTINSVDSGWAELTLSARGWSWQHRERIDRERYWQRTVTEATVTAD